MNKESFTDTAKLEYPEAFSTYNKIHEKLTVNNDYKAIFVTCYLCGIEGHISVNCEENFPEIEGNLKKQIFKMKQKLMKMNKQKKLEEKNNEDDKSKSVSISKQVAEEDTEEIKTEVFLPSEGESSSSSDSSEGSSHKKDSRRGSQQSSLMGLNKNQSPDHRGPGLGGAFRLNVSVGQTNIQTADKYKKKA